MSQLLFSVSSLPIFWPWRREGGTEEKIGGIERKEKGGMEECMNRGREGSKMCI